MTADYSLVKGIYVPLNIRFIKNILIKTFSKKHKKASALTREANVS